MVSLKRFFDTTKQGSRRLRSTSMSASAAAAVSFCGYIVFVAVIMSFEHENAAGFAFTYTPSRRVATLAFSRPKCPRTILAKHYISIL